MSIQWKERPGSGEITTGENPSRLDRYALIGTADSAIAYVLAMQFSAPLALGAGQVLYRGELRLAHQGYDLWYVDVPYGRKKNEQGQYTFSMTSQGGQVRIRHGKSETSYPAGGPALANAIDFDGKEAKGVDIVIPAVKFTYQFKHPLGVVSEQFAIALAELVGRTNSAAWHGMPIGSALFLGFQGQGGTEQDTTISYEVAYSKNLTNATIAGITGVSKKGWEVAWEYTKLAADGGEPAVEARWIYVNQVYDTFDFTAGLGF